MSICRSVSVAKFDRQYCWYLPVILSTHHILTPIDPSITGPTDLFIQESTTGTHTHSSVQQYNSPWWRNGTETLSELQTLCERYRWISLTSGFSHRGRVMRNLDVSRLLNWTICEKNLFVGDWRPHGTLVISLFWYKKIHSWKSKKNLIITGNR